MKRRLLNILIGFDQFCQVIIYLGAWCPNETISGIIGRKIKNGTANWLEKAICFVLRKLQYKHCIRSIDTEETLSRDA